MTRPVITALLCASVIIGAAVGFRYAEEAGFLAGGAERSFGVTMAMTLVWFGNRLPKTRTKNACGATPSRAFRLRRFGGIALMLGGIGHAAVWVFAPLDRAAILSTLPVTAALLAILAKVTRARALP